MLSFLLLAGCNPWDLAVNNTYYPDGDVWDTEVSVATDGVYVRLPAARSLTRVKADGTSALVDLDGATPDRLIVSPDARNLLTFASWPECKNDDPLIVTVEDCPGEDLVTRSELNLVRDGARVGGTAVEGVSGQFNAAAFSPDNSIAALYLDFQDGDTVNIDGSLNLTQVIFVSLEDAAPHSVSVGFAAEAVVFFDDSQQAVVLSRNQVALVNLATAADGCDAFSVCVTYPLALDADASVSPSDVALISRLDDAGTAERFALVSVANQSDVYILDLNTESIDIVDLGGVPAAMQVDNANDRTAVVYSNSARVDTIDHELFEATSTDLEEPMNAILAVPAGMLLYNTGGTYHDVYFFDDVANSTVEQRAENPIIEMRIAADKYAVATMQPESTGGSGATGFYDANYGLEIFHLPASASDDVADPVALALQGRPVGLATADDADGTYALVLMEGIETLLRVNLETALTAQVELSQPPIGIAALPDGGFVVTHDAALGLLSFVDPASGEITATASNFAATNLISEPVLPRRNVEE